MDVERASLGTGNVLFNPRSGAIVATDALGTLVAGHVEGGLSAVEIVDALAAAYVVEAADAKATLRAVVDGLVAQWDEAGLFAPERLEYPDPVIDHGRPVRHSAKYRTPYGAFDIASETRLLADQLNEILGVFSGGPEPLSRNRTSLRCVASTGGDFGVFSGEAIWGRATLDEARYLIIREAAEVLCGTDRVGAVMHGSSVSNGDTALLIMGDSGRGKSTLAQGLVAAGCGYVSDDHLPLHVGGRTILSFPTRSAVKPRARRLPEVKRLTRRYGATSRARDGVTYLAMPAAADVGEEIPVSALVFPNYQKGASLNVTKLTSQEAFEECIVAGARPTRAMPKIRPLATLCKDVPAFRLEFGASEHSIPTCLQLLEDCKT